jgi:hypothetical protein
MTATRIAAAVGFALALGACASAPATRVEGPVPSPRYSPEEVVRIQVDALRDNDGDDRGIAIVFRFASPATRSATGPLPRFAAMIRSPIYQPMLNHLSAVYDDTQVVGDLARQQVAIATRDGRVFVYAFILRRQTEGRYAGCWMTEGVAAVSVIRLPHGEPA